MQRYDPKSGKVCLIQKAEVVYCDGYSILFMYDQFGTRLIEVLIEMINKAILY